MANPKDRQQTFTTDKGIRVLQIDSPLTSEGKPVANQDTVGVLYNPSNKSKVEFTLGSDGKQKLKSTSGWLLNKKVINLTQGNSMFQLNLDLIRDLADKYKAEPPKEEIGGQINYQKIFK